MVMIKWKNGEKIAKQARSSWSGPFNSMKKDQRLSELIRRRES